MAGNATCERMNAQLKIATWNVERPNLTKGKERERAKAINAELKNRPADILILTETNECIVPDNNQSAIIRIRSITRRAGTIISRGSGVSASGRGIPSLKD